MAGTVRQMPMVCPGHNRCIVELQYSPVTDEGVFLISACLDGKPMLRDGISGDWIGTFEGHKGAVWGACISDDTSIAATGSADMTANVWDARTGDCLQTFTQKHICKSVAFPREGDQLLTGGVFPTVNLYDVSRSDSTLLELPTGAIKFARFVHGSRDTILTGNTEGKIVRWDARSGKPIQETHCGAGIRSGELGRESDILTVVANDNTVQFYNSTDLSLIKKYPVPTMTESASLQPSGERYVSCGQDLTVRMCNFNTGEEIECLRGHHGPVMVVRFAPDGESYSTGADDGTIRIWQTNPKPNYTPSRDRPANTANTATNIS